MEQLKWPGMKDFQAAEKQPMVVEGETAGYYKSFKNLTLYWVLKAGHMTPPPMRGMLQRRLGGGELGRRHRRPLICSGAINEIASDDDECDEAGA
ncbi:hypothetical protein HPB50_024797 [Hyalomma asiaticum]|uniref:Uncharacterized protein n=1 Tax=Hyalomma asiaticum TaxID=266040 RepID=A0ACB7T9D1_HYAAI|nr:hypothetical protein HPB50_024797 [Hyalomma asiaticum]